MAPAPVVWLGWLLAVLGGCSLIYNVDDLTPAPLPPLRYGPATRITPSRESARNPTLVGDGSYVYYTNSDTGGDDESVWRRDRGPDGWSEQREVMPLSRSPDEDLMPRLTASGGRLYLIRPEVTGLEVFVTNQTATLHTWDSPTALANLDEPGDERVAAPCDGAATIFVIHAILPVTTLEEVVVGSRTTVEVGDLTDLRAVSASPDCLRLLIAARGANPDLDLFVIRRRARSAPWAAPERLDALSTTHDESSPSSTADGELIVFARDGGLWAAHLIP